jgi:hypothetical protein
MIFCQVNAQNYYSDVSQVSGFNAIHRSFESQLGMGQAFLDVENDGDEDIIVSNQDGSNYLFINDGAGQFSEMAQYDDVKLALSHSIGISITDYNNDGWQDIFIASYGQNKLLRNNNGLSFTDVSIAMGITADQFSIATTWADINGDGWLDFYVINYTVENNPLEADRFYLNNKGVNFIEISSDLVPSSNLSKHALAVQFIDYDNDGDQDLYVVNDKLEENTLWRNDGKATANCGSYVCFTDVSLITNTNREVFGMGIAIADYDLDGDYDFYFSSIAEQVMLESQISQGSQSFIEKSNTCGLNFDAVGWSTLFLDINNDSYPDAYLATANSNASQSDRLYLNNQNNYFNDTTTTSGINDLLPTIGAAKGDYNNDGKIDLVVGNYNNNYMLYKNTSIDTNNWVKFKLQGRGLVNKLAIGSHIEVTTSSGKKLITSITSGGSHGAGNSLIAHLGLANDTIVSIKILWTDGLVQIIQGLGINSLHVITHPAIYQDSFE